MLGTKFAWVLSIFKLDKVTEDNICILVYKLEPEDDCYYPISGKPIEIKTVLYCYLYMFQIRKCGWFVVFSFKIHFLALWQSILINTNDTESLHVFYFLFAE